MSVEDVLGLVIETANDEIAPTERADIIYALLVILSDLATDDFITIEDAIKNMPKTREIPYLGDRPRIILKEYPTISKRVEKILEDDDDGVRYDSVMDIIEKTKKIQTSELKKFLEEIANDMYVSNSTLELTPSRLVTLANVITPDPYNFWHSLLIAYTDKGSKEKNKNRLNTGAVKLKNLKSEKFKKDVLTYHKDFPIDKISKDLRSLLVYYPTRDAIWNGLRFSAPHWNERNRIYMQFTPKGQSFPISTDKLDPEIGLALGFYPQELFFPVVEKSGETFDPLFFKALKKWLNEDAVTIVSTESAPGGGLIVTYRYGRGNTDQVKMAYDTLSSSQEYIEISRNNRPLVTYTKYELEGR